VCFILYKLGWTNNYAKHYFVIGTIKHCIYLNATSVTSWIKNKKSMMKSKHSTTRSFRRRVQVTARLYNRTNDTIFFWTCVFLRSVQCVFDFSLVRIKLVRVCFFLDVEHNLSYQNSLELSFTALGILFGPFNFEYPII